MIRFGDVKDDLRRWETILLLSTIACKYIVFDGKVLTYVSCVYHVMYILNYSSVCKRYVENVYDVHVSCVTRSYVRTYKNIYKAKRIKAYKNSSKTRNS